MIAMSKHKIPYEDSTEHAQHIAKLPNASTEHTWGHQNTLLKFPLRCKKINAFIFHVGLSVKSREKIQNKNWAIQGKIWGENFYDSEIIM